MNFEYLDENEFKKCERSLKKYNMVAYKKLVFDFYPKLRSGEFVGKIISCDKEGNANYEAVLPTDQLFVKVYGEVKLNYTFYEKNVVIIFTSIEPKDILLDGYKSELTSYKGIMISKTNVKDKFKIDLLDLLDK